MRWQDLPYQMTPCLFVSEEKGVEKDLKLGQAVPIARYGDHATAPLPEIEGRNVSHARSVTVSEVKVSCYRILKPDAGYPIPIPVTNDWLSGRVFGAAPEGQINGTRGVRISEIEI